jgi:hypothetical protein
MRKPYQEMTSCSMSAQVTCGAGDENALTFSIRCSYVPDGECTVELLAPETVKGVTAIVDGDTLRLTYKDDQCLNAGTLGSEEMSPAVCLPRMMDALRKGWLLEENREKWNDVPCVRMALDQTGSKGGKIISTLWLRQNDGTPVHGEITVDKKIILQAEFTDFKFHDILKK